MSVRDSAPPAHPEDRLPPPAETAPDAEWSAYGETLRSIREGRDPLLETPQPGAVRSPEVEARRVERRKAAEAAYQAFQERIRAKQERTKEETRRRLIESGIDPDRPPPPRLVDPPVLAPPTKP
jgi:hypothetical protein